MEPISLDDADLVARTLGGDREAFGQLYDRHARMVRAVVAAVSGEWSTVDDMSQECFLRGYRKLATLRDPGHFKQWIVGIARQVGRERKRSLARDRHEFHDQSLSEVNANDNSELATDERHELDSVMQKLATLPEQERLAVHTFFLHEQKAEQAAELLGLSRSGFYAVLQRAVARLAKELRAAETSGEKE
jgi:RNA polymerase sigma-70 factor, ECF subfamily